MTNTFSNSIAAGLLPEELCLRYNLSPSFRGKQIFKWIHSGATSFLEMTNLPLSEREKLSNEKLFSSTVEDKLEASDGSVKLKIRLYDGAAIEAVLLCDAQGRRTACLSTQVGCQMACAFCKTGTLGFLRNLEAGEIVEEFLHLSKLFGKPENIVFMGMGEPLLNIDNLRKAINIFTYKQSSKDSDNNAMSKRKITISTCGIVPGIIDLANNGPYVRLAVSITSADDALRTSLMPVNKSYNLATLKKALLLYQEKSGDRITLEAALIGGKNCDQKAVDNMMDFVSSLNVQVNIIPWNPIPELPLTEPTNAEVAFFESELIKQGINVVCRAKKGRNVSAACGQLGETLIIKEK